MRNTIAEFEEHKKELLLELGSRRSSSRASSVSSAAVRAQLRAEAAAALKRVETQKKRSIAEAQSTLLIQQEEMALARKRKEEQDRMEHLRLEEEAEVAMEKVKVVDQELGDGISMQELQDLPEVSTRDKVERFITEQCAPAYHQQSQSTHHGPHHDNQCAPAYPQQSQSIHHGPHHDNQCAPAYPQQSQSIHYGPHHDNQCAPAYPQQSQSIHHGPHHDNQCAPAYPQQSQSIHYGPHHDNQCAPAYPQQSQSIHHGPHHDNQCAPAYPQQSQSIHHGPHHDNQCAPAYPQQSQSIHHGPHHDNQSATAYPPIPQVAVTITSREGEPLPHRPVDLNPNATEYHANNCSPQSDPGNEMKSYVNFMARRELIANKIEKFDDNPVNYHTWKASFKNMIRNVGITPSEEFSLLVEYTTLTSKSLVQRL